MLDFVLKVYIIQKYKNGMWHSIVYYSRKLTLVEQEIQVAILITYYPQAES